VTARSAGDRTGETATADIVDALRGAGHEPVPASFGSALPGGTVWRLTPSRRSAPESSTGSGTALDAVCLDLHGSMYAEGDPDPEGTLLAAVRGVVGPDVPITVSLDMHATITERVVHAVDGVTTYRTAPHTDVYDSGVRAATLLDRLLDGAESVVERVYLPGERSETDAPPMAGLVDRLEAVDGRPGVFEAAYSLGFPWADSPHRGCCAVVTGDADRRDAVRFAAADLGEAFWTRRGAFEFTTEAFSLDAALNEALDTDGTPLVLSDSGDNPTAGAAQGLTVVDARLRARGIEDALVVAAVDPESYGACARAGEGSRVRLELGRAFPEHDAPPLDLDVTVERIGRMDDVPATVVTADRTAVRDPDALGGSVSIRRPARSSW